MNNKNYNIWDKDREYIINIMRKTNKKIKYWNKINYKYIMKSLFLKFSPLLTYSWAQKQKTYFYKIKQKENISTIFINISLSKCQSLSYSHYSNPETEDLFLQNKQKEIFNAISINISLSK